MKKKSIMISALGLVLCLSLVLTVVFHSPFVAFAVEMPEDNSYVFETGDAFHVIGWYGDWKNDYPKPTDKRWIDSKLTYNGSKWKTDPYMRWQNTDQPQNFLGVWPYNLVDSSTDLTNISYNTLTAAEKDILAARTTLTQKPADHTVPMAFDHLMSRFDVNLSFANQYQSVDDVVVKVNVGTDATIDLIANNITLGNEQNDVNLNVIDTVTGMDCSRSGILIPQTKTDVVITIDFKADGLMKSVTYTMPELKLESGKRTTLNLLVGDEVVSIENVTVSDWADGGNITGGEAEECMHENYDANNYCTVCGKKKEDGQ